MSNDKIADLKARFVAGAIPRENDFATLLNMLEETRAATGTSPDAPKSASLKLSSEGYLDVAVAPDGGLLAGTSGLSLISEMAWARVHAVSTGAAQYGLWKDGYVFLYLSQTDDKRKLQICMARGNLYVSSSYPVDVFNTQGTRLNSLDDANGYYAKIEGWTDRDNYKDANTYEFNGTTQDYAGVSLTYINQDVTQTQTINIKLLTV